MLIAKKPKNVHPSREQRVLCGGTSTLNSSPSQQQPAHTTKTHSRTCQAHTPQPTEKKPRKRSPLRPVSVKGGGEVSRCGSPGHTWCPSFPVLSMRLVTIHSTTKQTINSQTKAKGPKDAQNQDMHMFSFPLSVS